MSNHYTYQSEAGGEAAGAPAAGGGDSAAGALASPSAAAAPSPGSEAIFGGDAAAAAAAAAETTSVVPEWAQGFEDPSVRSLVANKQWQSPESLIESYMGLESKMGASDSELIRLKGIDDREAWHGKGGIFQRLGRPETAEGYEFPSIQADEGRIDLSGDFAKFAFEQGLSKTQGEAAVAWFTANMEGAENADKLNQEAKQASELQAVKIEWGSAWDSNVAIAQAGMKALGIDQAMAAAIESEIGTRELLMRMNNVGRLVGEHNIAGSGGPAAAGYMSPAEAQGEINTLKADPDFMAKWMEGEPSATKKMSSLHVLAHPG